jgi:hypothetical protein
MSTSESFDPPEEDSEESEGPEESEEHDSLNYRPPAYVRLIKVGMIVAGVLAGLSVFYVIFWFYTGSQFRQGVADWSAGKSGGIENINLAYSRSELSGFPFQLILSVDDPVFDSTYQGDTWSLSATQAVAEIGVFSSSHIEIAFSGRKNLEFSLQDGAFSFNGALEDLFVALETSEGGLTKVETRIEGLDLVSGTSDQLSFSRADIMAERGLDAESVPDQIFLNFDLKAQDLHLPKDIALPLDQEVQKLALSGRIQGEIAEGPLPQSLAAWRDEGGKIVVKGLEIAYGPLDLKTVGTLALDEELQLIGAFIAKIQGFFEMVNALKQKNLVSVRESITAKFLLGALARPAREGKPSSLSLAVTLQDKTIYAGPVPLVKLEPIKWGEAPEESDSDNETKKEP